MGNKLPVKIDDLIGAIARTHTQLKADIGTNPYLKLSKGGFFIYGADDIECEEGALWAVNPASFMLGYVAWPKEGTGAPTGEEMRGITEDPVIQSQLPAVDGAWSQQVAMQLMCISGEDVGTEVIYKASSKGGISGFNDFLGAVMDTLSNNPKTDKVVPVVELEVTSYKHPTYGKIFTPIFAVKKWVTLDEMPTEDADDTEPMDDPVEKPVMDSPIPREPVAEEPTAPVKKRRRRRKTAA